jgi:hypothetical protein
MMLTAHESAAPVAHLMPEAQNLVGGESYCSAGGFPPRMEVDHAMSIGSRAFGESREAGTPAREPYCSRHPALHAAASVTGDGGGTDSRERPALLCATPLHGRAVVGIDQRGVGGSPSKPRETTARGCSPGRDSRERPASESDRVSRRTGTANRELPRPAFRDGPQGVGIPERPTRCKQTPLREQECVTGGRDRQLFALHGAGQPLRGRGERYGSARSRSGACSSGMLPGNRRVHVVVGSIRTHAAFLHHGVQVEPASLISGSCEVRFLDGGLLSFALRAKGPACAPVRRVV